MKANMFSKNLNMASFGYRKTKPETKRKNREEYKKLYSTEIKWLKENLNLLKDDKFMIDMYTILVTGSRKMTPKMITAVRKNVNSPQYDVGVHLTFTCEYDTLRWSAISTTDPQSGLVDAEGYLWRTREDSIRHVTEKAAEAEMRAQIDRAIEAGIDVTHIDTHMGSVVHPKFISSYLKLADEYGVPAFLPNITKERLSQLAEGETADDYVEVLEKIDKGQVPTLDAIIINTLIDMDDKKAYYRELIDDLKPGLTHLLFHPAKKGDELNAIADTFASRNADYLAFSDPEMKVYIEEAGISHIGYRDLRAHLGKQRL